MSSIEVPKYKVADQARRNGRTIDEEMKHISVMLQTKIELCESEDSMEKLTYTIQQYLDMIEKGIDIELLYSLLSFKVECDPKINYNLTESQCKIMRNIWCNLHWVNNTEQNIDDHIRSFLMQFRWKELIEDPVGDEYFRSWASQKYVIQTTGDLDDYKELYDMFEGVIHVDINETLYKPGLDYYEPHFKRIEKFMNENNVDIKNIVAIHESYSFWYKFHTYYRVTNMNDINALKRELYEALTEEHES